MCVCVCVSRPPDSLGKTTLRWRTDNGDYIKLTWGDRRAAQIDSVAGLAEKEGHHKRRVRDKMAR